jgi:hypothetical protein
MFLVSQRGGLAISSTKMCAYLAILCCLTLCVVQVCQTRGQVNDTSQWTGFYSVTGSTSATSIVQCADGGYAIVGLNYTTSYNDPNSGDIPGSIWLIRLDSLGQTQWTKIIPGEVATSSLGKVSLIATGDGGFAVAASSWSKRTDAAGGPHYWLTKLDGTGSVQFSKVYGPSDNVEYVHSVIQTSDGGFALVGEIHMGWIKGWIVKVDSSGMLQWNSTYAEWNGILRGIAQSSDGGYIACGLKNEGDDHGWLVKVDASGVMQWEKTYFSNVATFKSVVLSADGGYAIGGFLEGTFDTSGLIMNTNSFALLAKTDAAGNLLWAKAYNGSYTNNVVQADGKVLISPVNSNLTMWNQTYNEGDTAGTWTTTMKAYSLIRTTDGGYALVGELATTRRDPSWGLGGPFAASDYWLVKTDSAGSMQWNHAYGFIQGDVAKSVIQTADGGYALIGNSVSNVWLVKTDNSGATKETAQPSPSSAVLSPSPSIPEFSFAGLVACLVVVTVVVAEISRRKMADKH